MTDYKKQYLKYKKKYLKIKKMLGGSDNDGIKSTKKERLKDAIKSELPNYVKGDVAAREQIAKNNAKEERIRNEEERIRKDEEENIKTAEVNNNLTKIATGLTFIGSLIAILVITLKN
tara:strand:- start:419 stop:772 length:354 start_codon:yes stop_codon:yes gene_type:complete